MPKYEPPLDEAVTHFIERIGGVQEDAKRQPQTDDYRAGWRDALIRLRASDELALVQLALTKLGWVPPRHHWEKVKEEEVKEDAD